jgi:tRNA A-37 threonylcarbamoyl transferase component Bud32
VSASGATGTTGDPASPVVPPSPAMIVAHVADGRGRLRLVLRRDADCDDLRRILIEGPERLAARRDSRSAAKEARRERRKRLVGATRMIDASGRGVHVFVKAFRIRTIKDCLEELWLGKRALRALACGLEAERRGIRVARHLGAACAEGLDRWPGSSVVVAAALERRVEAHNVLRTTLAARDRRRRAFLRGLGAFLGDAHDRGIVHGDFKAGNAIALEVDPPSFALIDLDRASFRAAGRRRLSARDAIELYRLVKSLRRVASRRERLAVLAAYRRARSLPRGALARGSVAIALRFAGLRQPSCSPPSS